MSRRLVGDMQITENLLLAANTITKVAQKCLKARAKIEVATRKLPKISRYRYYYKIPVNSPEMAKKISKALDENGYKSRILTPKVVAHKKVGVPGEMHYLVVAEVDSPNRPNNPPPFPKNSEKQK